MNKTSSVSDIRNPVFLLASKELSTLFNSPATYVVFVVFLLISGWLFVTPLFQADVSSLNSFLQPLPLLFTFLIPALTMRSFAEEFREGTIEYLATLPIRDYEVVLAKYLAAMGLLAVLMLFTLVFPLILLSVGRPDIGEMVGGYVAVFGLGSLFGSIGLWASSLTRNQVVAFIVAFFVCFLFFMLGRVADFLPGVFANFVRGLSVEAHFEALSRGVLDSRDLIYWASGTIFFLSANLMVLHSRRWR